jgi:hypothetical protein
MVDKTTAGRQDDRVECCAEDGDVPANPIVDVWHDPSSGDRKTAKSHGPGIGKGPIAMRRPVPNTSDGNLDR